MSNSKKMRQIILLRSLDISYRADNFLSRTVDRQAKPKDSGGSGGSSTHVSSSGTTHGGSSGKF